ncbi:MAG: hypothetical protein AB3N14_00510 [Flavobacteriaceae bacterium]
MKRLFFLGLTLVCTLFACTDRDDDINEVKIRIKNASSITFDEVQVGDAEEVHTNVAPNDFSEYLVYETAYRYAFIEIKSGEETFTLQPIDFVGETALPIGLYTYELDVSAEGDVMLEFKID